ncbi:MAG: M56 family metallopeptidase, partial [Clostridia bacterium]
MSLLDMTLAASLLIALTIVVRALGVGKLPKKTFLALWGVALFRLLAPIAIPSPLSIWSLFERATPALNRAQFAPITRVAQSPAALAPVADAYAQAARQAPSAPPTAFATASPWLIAWLIGLLACGAFFLATHLRCRLRFRASLPCQDAQALAWLNHHAGLRPVRIRVSDQICAPLTYGVFRPVILLPRQVDSAHLPYLLTHELTHIRRLDVLWKGLLALAACVHWFNPFVWTMLILANRDLELACDEAVVRKLGESSKSAYAMLLIDLEEHRAGLTPLCSGFSKNAIEERILSIMKMKIKKNSLVATVLATGLVLTSTAAFATTAGPTAATTTAKAQAYTAQEAFGAQLSQDSAQAYAIYAPYGLVYVPADGRLYYEGKKVRRFEDLYPVSEGAFSGSVCAFPDGEIDVHAVRDLQNPLRNADGSYDPSGTLLGLTVSTQAEYDARTLDAQPAIALDVQPATALDAQPAIATESADTVNAATALDVQPATALDVQPAMRPKARTRSMPQLRLMRSPRLRP